MNKNLLIALSLCTLSNLALAAPPDLGPIETIVQNELNNPVPVTITDPAANIEYVRIELFKRWDCGVEVCPSPANFELPRYEVPEGKLLLVDHIFISDFNAISGYAYAIIIDSPGVIALPRLGALTVVDRRGASVSSSAEISTSGRIAAGIGYDEKPDGIVAVRAQIFGRLVDGSNTVIKCDDDGCL